MQPNNTKAQKLILILKGIAMGIANKIPGVSGGIVALAAGFYEELIYSFSSKIEQIEYPAPKEQIIPF